MKNDTRAFSMDDVTASTRNVHTEWIYHHPTPGVCTMAEHQDDGDDRHHRIELTKGPTSHHVPLAN
jgi:hypothetical protein